MWSAVRQRLHRHAAGLHIGPDGRARPVREMELRRTERGAQILDHCERMDAVGGALVSVFAEAQQALVVRLVVPVAEKYSHQTERVNLGATGAARRRIDLAQLLPRPASGRLRLELTSLCRPFDDRRVEILMTL